jgi:hypothetical protein
VAEPKSRRNACLIVAVLISPLILSVFVVVALGAYVVTRETPLRDFFSEKPDAQEYSEEVIEIREEVAADLDAARKDLEQNFAKLPPECPLPEGWRLETMLKNAWFEVEEESIRDLTTVALYSLRGKEEVVRKSWADLTQRLGTATAAGNATELEKRFAPNGRSVEDVLAQFRDYVLQADYLDQLETAIDYGVARYVPERPFDFEDATERRLRTASKLLVLRVLYALQENDVEGALETCYRIQCLARPEVMPYAVHWYREYMNNSANRALMLVMSYGGISEPWRERLVQESTKRFEGSDTAALLLAQAVAEPDMYDSMPFFNQVQQTNRVFEGVKAGTQIMEPPLVQCRDDMQALLVEFGVEDFEEEDQSFISDFFDAMRMNPADLIVGMEVEMTLEDAVGLYRVRFNDEVARTAFVLEAFYAEHGEYPEKLDTLSPEFLDAVPVDPVFGEPLGYEHKDEGYNLTLRRKHQFSWTDDKNDDAGVAITLTGDETPEFTAVWKVRKDLFSEEEE